MIEPIYNKEGITVYHGDCIEVLEQYQTTNVFDCIVTDPPYGIKYVSNMRKYKHLEIANDDTLFLPFERLTELLRNDSSMFIFFSHKVYLGEALMAQYVQRRLEQEISWIEANTNGEAVDSFIIQQRLKSAYIDINNFRSNFNLIVWAKPGGTMGNLEGDFGNAHELIGHFRKGNPKLQGWKRYSNIWEFSRTANNLHPTQKPVSVIQRILDCSTSEGDLVLDCFGGSGTTAIACKAMNRRCVIIEFEEKYCEVIINRLERMSQHEMFSDFDSSKYD